jgi:copper homeostasis protein
MMRPAAVRVEICVDDVAGALAAEASGADRIELCAALSEGGLTPSLGLVRTVVERVPRIGIQIMIRPRGGDFTVSGADLDVMLADIALIRATIPDDRIGFVFGVLDETDAIDRAAVRRLKSACGTAPTTFHKAFDGVRDMSAALEELVDLGIDRVLTSGGAASAQEGADRLRQLVEQAGGRIVILAGGRVRAGHVGTLLARTGIGEVHLRAMRPHPTRPPVTSGEDIAALVAATRAAR